MGKYAPECRPVLSLHSREILTIQLGKPCYLSILANRYSDPEKYQAGGESLSCSVPESTLAQVDIPLANSPS